MSHLRFLLSIFVSLLAACTVPGPPAFPENTTAILAGPQCEGTGMACRCADEGSSVGEPPPGYRRFEVRLPNTIGTSSAVAIEGIGSLLRDEGSVEGSCFYIDLRPGATHQVRYLAQAHTRERGISVAFSIRELSENGDWYDVIRQRCGTSDYACHYESVGDWTSAVEEGHRFHDPCGSTVVDGMRVDGGLYDRRFTDAEFSFFLMIRQEAPLGPPRSACNTSQDGDTPAAENSDTPAAENSDTPAAENSDTPAPENGE